MGLIFIFAASGCKKDVEACFTHTPGLNHKVHFNASCSVGADAYDWDFGLGQGVSAISEQPTAFYPGAGEYAVTLRVTSQDGRVSTSTKLVNVN